MAEYRFSSRQLLHFNFLWYVYCKEVNCMVIGIISGMSDVPEVGHGKYFNREILERISREVDEFDRGNINLRP